MAFLFRVAAAIAVAALGCGARTTLGGSTPDAGVSFPLGTYDECAFGTVASGPFLLPAGFDEDASLTISSAQNGTLATYVDAGGRTYAWQFDATSSATALLSPSAQTTAGFGTSICADGVGVSNEEFFPTDFAATAGALGYASGVMFLSLTGDVTSTTDCGDVNVPGSVWIACTGGPAPDVSAPPAAAPLPIGAYACTSQIGTHVKNLVATSGNGGTLELAQSGAQVTAHYEGDIFLGGDLVFTTNAEGAATAAAGQTFSGVCDPDTTPATISISAASLTAVAGTVFLSFAGTTTGSTCPGAQKIAALVCTKN